jgi:hypothetical protein
MKKTNKELLSETKAAGMPSGYAVDMTGKGQYDMTGRGDMINKPVVAGAPVTHSMNDKVHVTARTAKDINQATLTNEQEGEETDEMGDEEMEETNEDISDALRDSLVSLLGEDVDPNLVNQLEAIFEAAVTDRVEQKVAAIVEDVDGNVKTYLDNVTESLVEKVDDYLDYVVEEWMTDNAVAVEQGIKTQIAENFISGLKNLFENHYIDVPAEKYNVLDELYAQNRELQTKLNESFQNTMNLRKEISLTECAGIFVAETRDLADTQVSKLQNLMENINFTTPEEYREKLVAIKENYLNKRPVPTRIAEPEQTFAPVKQAPTTLVESYVGALGRLHKKV